MRRQHKKQGVLSHKVLQAGRTKSEHEQAAGTSALNSQLAHAMGQGYDIEFGDKTLSRVVELLAFEQVKGKGTTVKCTMEDDKGNREVGVIMDATWKYGQSMQHIRKELKNMGYNVDSLIDKRANGSDAGNTPTTGK